MNLSETAFDIFERYSAVSEILKFFDVRKILDVGGGAEGAALNFLPDKDVWICEPALISGKKMIRCSGQQLCFVSDSFDAVISVDVLEHIPCDERECFLSELIRVSKKYVIVACPFFDTKIVAIENLLFRWIQNTTNFLHPDLEQHIKYGLPDFTDTEEFLKRKGCAFFVFGNSPLLAWALKMALCWLLQASPENRLLVPDVHKLLNQIHENVPLNQSMSYRKLFIIDKSGDSELKGKIADSGLKFSAPVLPQEKTEALLPLFILLESSFLHQLSYLHSSFNKLLEISSRQASELESLTAYGQTREQYIRDLETSIKLHKTRLQELERLREKILNIPGVSLLIKIKKLFSYNNHRY